MNKFFWNGFCFVAIIVALIIYACANRGYPQGGEKDVTTPSGYQGGSGIFFNEFQGKTDRYLFQRICSIKGY